MGLSSSWVLFQSRDSFVPVKNRQAKYLIKDIYFRYLRKIPM
jgi:hypothetical protein